VLPTKAPISVTRIGRVGPERIPGWPRLTRAWLASPRGLSAIFPDDPSDLRYARAIAAYRSRTAPDRARLASIAREGLEEAGAPMGPERERSLAALGRPGSVAIVAGQQAGFATGPLFTLFKALTAVRIARRLGESGVRDVVPVFWCASDDHDLAEIDLLRSVDPAGAEVRKFRAGLGARAHTPAFAVRAEPAVVEAVERFAASLPSTEFSAEVRALLAPAPGEPLANWFLRALSGIPGLEELVAIEGRKLVPLAQRVLDAEISAPERSGSALQSGARRLVGLGYEPTLGPLAPPFLYELAGEDGTVRRRPVTAGRPLRGPASPNVALRPIVQAEALPAAVVVAGPSEIAYLAELPPLFERHGVPFPAIVPRFSATVIDARAERTLEALGLAPDAIFDLPEHAPAPAVAPDSFESAAAGAEAALSALEKEAIAVDPSLEKPARKLRESASSALAKLRERAREAASAASETSLRRYRRLLQSVLPDGAPQERVLGPWALLNLHGLDLARSIGETIDPGERSHAVLCVAAPGEPGGPG